MISFNQIKTWKHKSKQTARGITLNNRYDPLKDLNDTSNATQIFDTDQTVRNTEPNDDLESITAVKKMTPVLIGDSILSDIKGKVGRNVNKQEAVRSISETRVEALKHYIEPDLEKSPDRIIMHCGTNNLRSN